MANDEAVDLAINDVNTGDIKIPFGDLSIGEKYVIRGASRSNSVVSGREIQGVKVDVTTPEGLDVFTYLPSKFKTLSDAVISAIDQKGKTLEPYFVVRYGRIGLANIAKLHPHEQDIDQVLLKKLKGMSKRQSEESQLGNASKRMKTE